MERLLVGFALVMLGCGFIIGNVEQIDLSTLGTMGVIGIFSIILREELSFT